MEHLVGLDRWLLMKINQDWSNSFFDSIFPAITDFHKTNTFSFIFLPLFVLIVLWSMRSQGVELILTLCFSLSISDSVCGKIIKPLVGRMRPPYDGMDVVIRAPIFGQFGFPSNHAANIFCAATILGAYFPKARWYFFLYAFLVAYSRSYVGAHYPLDWIMGALFGVSIGLLGLRIKDVIIGRIRQRDLNL